MKKLVAMVLALSLMLGLIPALAAAEDDWVTLRVEMYDRSTAGFNVEDCWQLHRSTLSLGHKRAGQAPEKGASLNCTP